MHNVSINRSINKPTHEVWKALDNFSDVYKYHPQVRHSESINKLPTGIGAERTCHFENGNIIKERIIAYESGKEYEIDIYDAGSFPLRKAVGRFQVNPISDNSSNVIFSMSFQPKFGPLGWLMAQLMMKNQFSKTLSDVLEGLDKNLQSGEVVSRKDSKTKAA